MEQFKYDLNVLHTLKKVVCFGVYMLQMTCNLNLLFQTCENIGKLLTRYWLKKNYILDFEIGFCMFQILVEKPFIKIDKDLSLW